MEVEHSQVLRLHEFINTQYYPFISEYRHKSYYLHLHTPLKAESTIHSSPHLGILFTQNDTLDRKICRIALWNKTNDKNCTVRNIQWKTYQNRLKFKHTYFKIVVIHCRTFSTFMAYCYTIAHSQNILCSICTFCSDSINLLKQSAYCRNW